MVSYCCCDKRVTGTVSRREELGSQLLRLTAMVRKVGQSPRWCEHMTETPHILVYWKQRITSTRAKL